MLCMILRSHPHIQSETSLAKVFGHPPNDASDSSIERSIFHDKVKFFFFGANRPAGNANTLDTWYLMVIDVVERTIYFVDPVSSSHGLSEQQRDIFSHMRHIWKQCMNPKDSDNFAVTLKAINLPLVQSTPEVNSGFACVISASLLARPPIELFNTRRNGSTSFEVSRVFNDMIMIPFEECLQLKVHPQWRRPSVSHPLVQLPRVPFDGSLVALALSVKRGNWNSLTKLVQSVFGRLPIASDNVLIPSQSIPCNITSAKDKRGPSGLEISAYLHMVLVDFVVDGQRTPKVMIESSFGDFLMRNAPRDVEWCNPAMENKPQFLIFSRVQGMVGPHRYVIIVDVNARQAYCFDSIAAQDTRAEHIEAFALLQEVWAVWLPWTLAPERMVELPSFTQESYLNSGFLCMYHILLLFRAPMRLRKLKHGNVVATWKELDYIELYKKSIKKTTLVSRFAPNSNDNIREENAFRAQVSKEEHQPQKHIQKMSSARHEPIQENRSSWFSSFTARKLDTSGRGSSQLEDSKPAPTAMKPRSTKRNHHKADPTQYKIKAYQRGSTYKDMLGTQVDRAPVGSVERLNQYRTGVITTPFIRPGETLEEYSKRPIPNHPSDWQGWDWYEANMAAVDAANREEPPDRKAARVRLQQKRGRGGELMELNMRTLKPELQSKGKD
ncbi:hypothetical protein EV127DRAFT_446634 [Xylaria flabelliformis]|nr:hypothetical protein EV127DRAFT_446634 [Xylaria flabelliformis]